MIFSKQKDFQLIEDFLKDKKKVFLVGCGDCATTCKSGGREQMEEMKVKLEKAGKSVTGIDVPDTACTASQVKILMAKNRKALQESDAVVVFACGSGAQCFLENDRLGLDVFSGCDSLFAATIDGQGHFNEVCSACGDCILDLTEGICPVTRCAKGLLNGPCGGQKDGKCEVDREKECAWILIYKAKEKKKRLHDLRKAIPPKDHQKAIRPHAQ